MSLRDDSKKFADSVKLAPGLNPKTEELIRWALRLGYVTGVNDEIKRESEWRKTHAQV